MIKRAFCPTCQTRRPAVNHSCVYCGAPVRLWPVSVPSSRKPSQAKAVA